MPWPASRTPRTAWPARLKSSPRPRSSAGDRLNVYRQSYFARLIECVADDYPALQYLLGEDGFVDRLRAAIEAV
ncbi:MAG: putative DNA-binding domain-containing protein, partial [Pseudomonadota bacterium]